MAKKKVKHLKTKPEAKLSVKTYQHGIDTEKQEMTDYSKKFGTNVKSLKNKFKNYQKDLKEAALKMQEDGAKKMNIKINKFKGEIKAATRLMDEKVNKFNTDVKNQTKENKEAVNKIENGVKFLISEVNNKKKDFRDYAINEFWGISKE